ncbi:MAG: polyphenol oxidase family protein, partial [Candidatus Omnitrophica bacterium]|nr:polyphenol oxidase family protein [Candidatus Omnitrophota bacterium]
ILSITLDEIKKYFLIDLNNLYLAFGPAIRLCCYEVGQDVARFFYNQTFLKHNKIYLDLVEVNKNQAIKIGIRKENIFDSRICTSCKHEEFYSYRKGDKVQRTISLIMLR